MGSCFNSVTFDGKLPTEDLQKRFNVAQERARLEARDYDGRDSDEDDWYNGTISTLNSQLRYENVRVFPTHQAAIDFLTEKPTKGVAHVVRYKDIDTSKSKRYQSLEKKIAELWRDYRAKSSELRAELPLAKTLNEIKKHTNKTKKVEIKFNEKLRKLTEAKREIENKLAEKCKKEHWLVGGWCGA